MPATEKFLIVGLDGADWRVLQPEIDRGNLPVLARLQSEGSHGPLRSTIRPESSVAWSTFATGVNPGKHGVFGFVYHAPESYDFALADNRHVAARPFWDTLGESGRRVGLINVPFTYPPRPVNGFLIAGMLTPGAHVTFTHPPELQQAVLARFEALLFDSGDAGQEHAAIIDYATRYTEQQLETALWLMREESWSCLTIVFTALDRLQHFLWDTPAHTSYLRRLDQALGRLLEAISDDTTVLLLSDHGFGGVANRYYINMWLQREGYLALKSTQPLLPLLEQALSRLKEIPGARRLKRWLLPTEWGPSQLKTLAFTRPIDWSRTKAYYAPDGGLRINLQGREPQGIVPRASYEALRRELITKLTELRDPRNDRPPIAEVFTREALYRGPYADRAPDLVVEPQRDGGEPAGNYLLDGKLSPPEDRIFTDSAPYNGNHASNGILLAWRPGVIAPQMLEKVDLQDVAPTVLAGLDVPIPENMDGRPLLELFRPEHRPSPTYTSDRSATPPDQAKGDLTDDDLSAVEERLRNLGYLD